MAQVADRNMASKTQVHTLLGRQHLELSLKCLDSFRRFNCDPFELVVHDDGTLAESDLELICNNLEPKLVVRRSEADNAIFELLARYPACTKFRQSHPLAMKLFDIALLGVGDISAIDSDVCFFREFHGLFTFEDGGTGAVFMTDFQNAYAVRTLDYWPIGEFRLPRMANTGIIYFRRRCYDLEFLEWMLRRHGPSMNARMAWWMEQTCWGILAGRCGCRLLDADQFFVALDGRHLSPETVGIHFVGQSRHLFDETYAKANLEYGDKLPSARVISRSARMVNGMTVAAQFGWMILNNKIRRVVGTSDAECGR